MNRVIRLWLSTTLLTLILAWSSLDPSFARETNYPGTKGCTNSRGHSVHSLCFGYSGPQNKKVKIVSGSPSGDWLAEFDGKNVCIDAIRVVTSNTCTGQPANCDDIKLYVNGSTLIAQHLDLDDGKADQLIADINPIFGEPGDISALKRMDVTPDLACSTDVILRKNCSCVKFEQLVVYYRE